MVRTAKLVVASAIVALAAGGLLLMPAPDACAIDAECVTITKSGNVGPVTGESTDDCAWAEMEARHQLGTLMSSFCSPDKICDNSISFGACTLQGGVYRVSATGWVECGRFF